MKKQPWEIEKPKSNFKQYLSDGVYAQYDGHSTILTTEDGIRATNTIVFEPETVRDLVVFLKKFYNF